MWSDRNLLRVASARLISRTGGEAAFFVGIWGKAAFEMDASVSELALLMAALGVAGLVGSAVGGMFIDRTNPKRVLIVGELLFVPVTLAATLTTSVLQLTLVAAGIGLVGAPLYAAITSFPPYLTTDADSLIRMNAAVETAGMASLITGTAIGAALASWVGLNSIFVFDAVTSVLGVALVLGVTLRPVEKSSEEEGGLAEIRAGFALVYRSARLRFYVLAGTSTWLLFGLFGALEPLFFRDVLGRGPETIGWVNSIFGVGLVAGTLLAARLPERLRTARVVVMLIAGNGLASLMYVGTDRLSVVVAGAIVWGSVIGVLFPMVRTLIHLNSPEEFVGRIMGTTLAHSESAQLVPLLAAPLLVSAFGVQRTLVGGGVLLALIASMTLRSAGRLDRTRSKTVPPIETGTVADEPVSPNR